jgi:hypothetical protein
MDPLRLLEGQLGPGARELLESARAEAPDASARAVLLRGIQTVPSVPPPLAPGVLAGPAVGVGAWIVGVGVATVVIAGALLVQGASNSDCVGARCAPPKAQVTQAVQAAAPPAQPAPAAASSSVPVRAHESAQQEPRPHAAAPRPRAPASPSLTAEIAALEPARLAVERGAPQNAEAFINSYLKRFPHGSLRPEALELQAKARAARVAPTPGPRP